MYNNDGSQPGHLRAFRLSTDERRFTHVSFPLGRPSRPHSERPRIAVRLIRRRAQNTKNADSPAAEELAAKLIEISKRHHESGHSTRIAQIKRERDEQPTAFGVDGIAIALSSELLLCPLWHEVGSDIDERFGDGSNILVGGWSFSLGDFLL